MADLRIFDANQVDPTSDFVPSPSGKYPAVITESGEVVRHLRGGQGLDRPSPSGPTPSPRGGRHCRLHRSKDQVRQSRRLSLAHDAEGSAAATSSTTKNGDGTLQQPARFPLFVIAEDKQLRVIHRAAFRDNGNFERELNPKLVRLGLVEFPGSLAVAQEFTSRSVFGERASPILAKFQV